MKKEFVLATVAIIVAVLLMAPIPSYAAPFDGMKLKYRVEMTMMGVTVTQNKTVEYTAYNETHFKVVETTEGVNITSTTYYEKKGTRIMSSTTTMLNITVTVEQYDPYWLPTPLADSCKQGIATLPVTLNKVDTASITVVGKTITAYVYEGNVSGSYCKYYYDEWSGILVKMESSTTAAGVTISETMVLISTNAQIGPPPSAGLPWMWIVAIVVVVVVVVVAVVLLIRRRKAAPPTPATETSTALAESPTA